jgi:hypothetical protein
MTSMLSQGVVNCGLDLLDAFALYNFCHADRNSRKVLSQSRS